MSCRRIGDTDEGHERRVRRRALSPSGWDSRRQKWRKRVRVERTGDGANPPPAGFEDREDHRTPCASVQKKRPRIIRIYTDKQNHPPRRIRANPCESVAELLGRDLLTRHGHCVLLRDGQLRTTNS